MDLDHGHSVSATSVYEGPKLPRSIFNWIALQDAEHEQKGPPPEEGITAEEISVKYGMPADTFIDHIAEEIEEAESCQSLPFTLLLVISYAMMVITHDNAVVFNAVEESVDFDIDNNANFAFSSDYIGHKNFEDVNSHPDFWSWITLGFVPLIFQQSHGFSEGLNMSHPLVIAAQETFPRNKRGMLLNYNRIVGGVRLRQERTDEGCFLTTQTEPLLVFYDKPCVGGRKYELEPDMWTARYTENPERVRWLYTNDDLDVVIDQLKEMETSFWLDEHTRKIEIALPMYNAEYGIHCLITVNFYFSRGGHIWKKIIPLSTFATMHDGWMSALPDVSWLGCIMYILVVEGSEIYQLVQTKGWRAICSEYIGFWNTVDWMSMIGALIICILFYIHTQNIDALNQALTKLGNIPEESRRAAFRAQAEVQMDFLEEGVQFAHGLKTMLAIYPMMIVLRLFKAFAAQPRLAVVTKTLVQCQVDIIHFFLVFVSVFITYAVSGVLLFGREIDGFTTFPRAINTCFRCMMGDFDWEELSVVGRMDAGVWFWTFMIVVVLLMLNMLMAIVMDAYGEVKANVGNAETLWAETKQAWNRMQGLRSGKHVPLESVLSSTRKAYNEMRRLKVKSNHGGHHEKAKEETEDGKKGGDDAKKGGTDVEEGAVSMRLCTVDFLKRVVDGLRTDQAVTLIKEAIEAYYEQEKEGVSEEELLSLIRKVNYRTKKMKKTLASWVDGPTIEEQIQMKAFSDELVWLRTELGHAASHIGVDPVDDEEEESEDSDDSLKERTVFRDAGVGTLQPFKSLDQVSKGHTVYVLENAVDVLKACHQCGISQDNDALREQAIGLAVEILDKDTHDDTLKCRVPGVGDLWFGVKALAPAPEDQPTKKEGGDDDAAAADDDDESLPDVEALEDEIKELEGELASGKATMSEAMMAVSELEYRLHQAHEERHDGARNFRGMKARLQAVQKESNDIREKIQVTEGKIETVLKTRNEYFDLVRNMIENNTNLKGNIAELDRHAQQLSTKARTTEAHHKMVQLALEARLDEALAERARVEDSTIRAYQMMAQHVENIADALEQASASVVRGGPSRDPYSASVARQLKDLRDGARSLLTEGAPGFDGDPDHYSRDNSPTQPPRSLGPPSFSNGGMNGHSAMNGHNAMNGHSAMNGLNGHGPMNGHSALNGHRAGQERLDNESEISLDLPSDPEDPDDLE